MEKVLLEPFSKMKQTLILKNIKIKNQLNKKFEIYFLKIMKGKNNNGTKYNALNN